MAKNHFKNPRIWNFTKIKYRPRNKLNLYHTNRDYSVHASILCLLQNLLSLIPPSLYPSFPVIPNCSWILSFAPEKVEKFLATLYSATGPDGISFCVLKTCSAALAPSAPSPLCSFHPVIYHLPGNQQTSQHYRIKVQKWIPLTRDNSAYFQLSTRSWHLSSQVT